MVKNIVEALIHASEKAANIARLCRQNEHLFPLLIEEKSSNEANPRFVRDFKTLADVLVQEAIRHDISNLVSVPRTMFLPFEEFLRSIFIFYWSVFVYLVNECENLKSRSY